MEALARELARSGHEPYVVTLEPTRATRSENGIQVISLRERFRVANILGFPSLGTRRALSRFLRAEGIEVVSVHTRFFPMSYLGVRAARSVKLPVIHTEHGSDHVVSNSPIISLASRLVDLTLGRWVLRHADEVLGVSESAVAFVKRLANIDARVFYNAISAPEFEPTHWPNRIESLVFVGRLVPGKGWEAFLDCISELRRRRVSVSGSMIGDGPDIEEAREKVRQLGLDSIVTVHGRLPQSAVRAALRGATLINPTVLAEGFQTTLLEAIAEGGRVITYPVPGATTLRDQGAPVLITDAKDTAALIQVVAARSKHAWRPASAGLIKDWTWPVRAVSYAEICAALQANASKKA